jgi:hypothetical protein
MGSLRFEEKFHGGAGSTLGYKSNARVFSCELSGFSVDRKCLLTAPSNTVNEMPNGQLALIHGTKSKLRDLSGHCGPLGSLLEDKAMSPLCCSDFGKSLERGFGWIAVEINLQLVDQFRR